MTQKYTVSIRDLDRLFETVERLTKEVENTASYKLTYDLCELIYMLSSDAILVKGSMSSDKHRHEWQVMNGSLICGCGMTRSVKDLT